VAGTTITDTSIKFWNLLHAGLLSRALRYTGAYAKVMDVIGSFRPKLIGRKPSRLLAKRLDPGGLLARYSSGTISMSDISSQILLA
jgi:hypothetical protein